MSIKKMRLGDLSIGFVHSIQLALAALDKPSNDLFAQFSLTNKVLAQANARLSIARFMRLGQAATQLSARPDFGLFMGQYAHSAFLGLAGLCISLAPTVRSAAQLMQQLEPLYAQNYRGQSQFNEDTNGAWLSFYSISPYNDYNRFVVESVLVGWLTQLSALCQQAINPQQVDIEYSAPNYGASYASYFNCPVHFASQQNRLYLTTQDLNKTNPVFCPSTWQALKEQCFKQLENLNRTFTWREKVTQLLAAELKQGEPSLELIAQQLKLPAWTLRRKLEAEGMQFRQLINHTRYSLACTYISDTQLSFSEIAWLLGFSSPAAFQRAFKRWSQLTPGDYRKQQIHNYNQALS